jgi:alpha-amylase/alpha-mannosidase (GH57 family)
MNEAGGPHEPKLDLVLVWHMHQPEYRDPASGEFRLPWVYLHALKDYADMAAHLERCPQMRATVNFVPVLLDQLEDYADQFATGRLRDPLLRLLARNAHEPFTPAERALVFEQCFHANHERLIAPFPAYQHLHALAHAEGPERRDPHGYLSDRYLTDLIVWYHLAWTGETLRRAEPLLRELMDHGYGYTEGQRRALLDLIGRTVSGIVPRYRRLEEAGTIELSTSPAWHPIAPLLLDFDCARELRPDLPLPGAATAYPGGAERLDYHLEAARASHEQRFGRRPSGLWPSEGAVSDHFVRTLAGREVGWIASGSQVLANSLRRAGRNPDAQPALMHRPYRLPQLAPGVVMFFRDDRRADLIGFEYRKWHSSDAALNFVADLEALAGATPGPRPVVTIVVDGENAWEYYPYNGYYFLSELYERIAAHPTLRAVTPRRWLAERAAILSTGGADPAAALPGLVAGSWVYGDLTTWIGSPDKNAGWDLLIAAKRACDEVLARGRLSAAERDAVLKQLAVCEGSDWCWWFGDYNPAEAVASFDRVYRAHLTRLYGLLGLEPPAALAQPVSAGSTRTHGEGQIRRAERSGG